MPVSALNIAKAPRSGGCCLSVTPTPIGSIQRSGQRARRTVIEGPRNCRSLGRTGVADLGLRAGKCPGTVSRRRAPQLARAHPAGIDRPGRCTAPHRFG